MNFTENFQEFSARLSRTDLALYAGIGIALWVMFKDRMSPVQKIVADLMAKVTSVVNTNKVSKPTGVAVVSTTTTTTEKQDVFFELVASWKQTRDLAVQSGCSQAVKVADQMFPFLSPSVCKEEGTPNDK
jgi:hypothetical protein